MKPKKNKSDNKKSAKINKQASASAKAKNKTVKTASSKTSKPPTETDYLASTFKYSDDVIIITDAEGKIEYTNPAFEKITGYKQKEILGKNPSLLNSGCLDDSFYLDLWNTIKNGKSWTGRLINKKKDSTLYSGETNIFPVKNKSGKIIKYISIQKDNCGKKSTDEDLLDKNRLLYYMIEAFTYPMYVIDAENGYVIVANNAAKAQNIKEGLHCSKLDYGLIAKSSTRAKRESPLEVIKKTKEPVYMDFSVMDKSGNIIYRELYDYPILDSNGNVTQIIEYVMDITDRKRSQEELIKLSQAVEQSLNIVMITNNKGIIEYVNPKFTEITGYTFQEVVGQKASSLGEIVPEEKNTFWEILGSEGEWRGEFHNRKKNGGHYWEYASIYAIKNSQNTVTHYIKDAVNISKRKQAEDELKLAKEKAEQANRFKSEFLANMSHEIRTPLNSILGFIELLLMTNLDRQQKDYFDTIKDSSRVLLGIIDDILDFSKIESGRLEIDSVKFYLKHEMEPVVDMFAARAYEKNIELLYFIDPALPEYIFGDPLRIKQVLNNLISNAVKFTHEKGKILVEIRLLNTSEEKCRVLFCVSDNGIGISKKKQGKLFHPFFQADSSISRRYGGTGLGLAISSHLVTAMGGELKFESEENEGSKFHFELEFTDFSKIDIFKRDYNFSNLKCFLFIKHNEDKIQLNNIERYLEAFNIAAEAFSSTKELLKLKFRARNIIFLDCIENTYAEINTIKGILPDMPLILIANRMDLDPIKHIIDNTIKVIYKPVYASKIIGAIIELLYNEKQITQTDSPAEIKRKINFNASALVAEDNAINQKLIILLLKQIGIDADLVKNGADAIEKFQSRKYDIILMDINMPFMDGIEASKKIIEIEKSGGIKHTPIIALTAKSMTGDKEEILESGMDAYLSKPISINKLYGALSPFLKNTEFYAESGASTGTSAKNTKQEINLNHSENFKNERSALSENPDNYDLDGTAMELGVSTDFLTNLISQFIANFDNYYESILKSVRDMDFDSIYKESHKIKGTALNLRLKKLAHYFLQMESNAKNKAQFDYIGTLKIIHAEFELLRKEFFNEPEE